MEDDVDYIKLQVDLMEATFILTGSTFEHTAFIGLATLVGFLISALTQVFKDADRFQKKDFDERIELQKLKIKY